MPTAVDYPTLSAPATPDYVLAVLRDWQRLEAAFDGLDLPPGDELRPEMTVREWRSLGGDDLLPLDVGLWGGWHRVGRGLNVAFGAAVPDAEWRRVLRSPRRHTLGAVCELIARHAPRPVAKPHPLFGCNGRAAGMFLTVRSMLAGTGADVTGVTPSTELAPYLARHFTHEVLGTLVRLAPGTLPSLRLESRGLPTRVLAFLLAGVVGTLAGFWLGSRELGIGCGFVTALGAVGHGVTLGPPSLYFVGLRTFRDLARCLAGGTV